MVNKERLIKKLSRKSEKITRVESEGMKIVEIDDIEKFYDLVGKLYLIENENTFYKYYEGVFFKLIQENKIEEEIVGDVISNKPQQIQIDPINLIERYKELVSWTIKFKEYVENKFSELEEKINKLESNQEEATKLILENIDLKVKSLEKRKASQENKNRNK